MSFQDGVLPSLVVLVLSPAAGADFRYAGEFFGFLSSDEKTSLTVSSGVIGGKFAESFRRVCSGRVTAGEPHISLC